MALFGSRRNDKRWGQTPMNIGGKRHVRELYTAAQMRHVLRRERARCDRNSGSFSLVLFKLEILPVKERNLMRLAKLVLDLIRETDEIGRFDDQTICAVLPDTAPNGAAILVNRVRERADARGLVPTCTVFAYPDAGPDDELGSTSNSNGQSNGHLSNGSHKDLHTNGNGNGHMRMTPSPDDSGELAFDQGGPALAILNMPSRSTRMEPATEVLPLGYLLAEPLPWWKRAVDIIASSIGILATLPLMIVAAIGIKLTSPGPIIFKQKRTGLGGKHFSIYKFRTMNVGADKMVDALRHKSEQDGPAFKLKNDPRIFRFGKLLRNTSIDELPQLFNILFGDMTLVGPRPLPIKEADACNGWYAHRHDVTPGLTCIWQVHGRSRVKFEDWMRMDRRYAKRRHLWSDIKLVIKTIPAVLLRRGAN
jgi:lipopolysaccharide/colanic/teichoic acid biosynthesis glycosyltransferase